MRRKLSIQDCRDPHEPIYLAIIYVVVGIFALLAAALAIMLIVTGQFLMLLSILAAIGALVLASWISWKLFVVYILGNSIEVSPTQYPQVYRVVKQASDLLDIQMPTIMILQGHGVFELFVARRFSRRGFIIITSNMMDEFASQPNSRPFMMFVGRQLGDIAAGHFNWWFLKDGIGQFALFFHKAWKRRCNFTADNIGLLAAGDLYAAEQALVIITAGARIASGTNYDAIAEQRTRLFESVFAWIRLLVLEYPYMIDRIVQLRAFVRDIEAKHGSVEVLPIMHMRLRTLPILLVHGHDHAALTELQEMLAAQFPFVATRVMLTAVAGSLSLPEKFEHVSFDAIGAIALVTPDDVGASVASAGAPVARPRQNVVMEIGWVWGRLGRNRCLLLLRGGVELPSDLAGVDVQRFSRSPKECIETVRAFIGHLDVGQREAA